MVLQGCAAVLAHHQFEVDHLTNASSVVYNACRTP